MRHTYIRLGIIAIAVLLALSTVSVTASPRSAAAPSVPDSYPLTLGKGETWGGQQFNYRDTQGGVMPGYGTHAESAVGNKLATSISWTTSTDVFQGSYAWTGVKVRLPGTYTPDEWATIKNTPVTLKTTVPYTLSAGTDGRAVLMFVVGAGYSNPSITLKEIKAGSTSGVASGAMHLRLNGIVSNYMQDTGVYQGTIYILMASQPQYLAEYGGTSPLGSASANAIAANIQLTWPEGASAS